VDLELRHPTAVIDSAASLADDVVVAPYAVIGPNVTLGRGCTIGAHAVIAGHTEIAQNTEIAAFAAIGTPPQDKKYQGEASKLIIGSNNVIREFTTLNPGTADDSNETVIGDDNLLMAYVHVAHDCRIGDRNVFSNGVQLAGHVTIASDTVVGGMSGIHQFVRIGDGAMVGGGSMATLDVAPYCLAVGNRATLHGLNLVGLKHRATDAESITAIKEAYKTMFRSGLKAKAALQQLTQDKSDPLVNQFLTFLSQSERGFCRPENGQNGTVTP